MAQLLIQVMKCCDAVRPVEQNALSFFTHKSKACDSIGAEVNWGSIWVWGAFR